LTAIPGLRPPQEAEPWAFWAPSDDRLIETALDLAGVGPGTSFLDLGCGDGRVLLAAARRGAMVRGVEANPDLAEQARSKLAAAGLGGTVEVGDLFAASMTADLIYAYLTPVMLSLLGNRLQGEPAGTRLVTPRYSVAGWSQSAFSAGCYLYQLPLMRDAGESPPGWGSRATIAVVPADRRVLIPLCVTLGQGDLNLQIDPALARAARCGTGTVPVGRPAAVPVDLIFRPHAAGSVIVGSARAQEFEITVAVIFARERFGQRNFDPHQGPNFRLELQNAIAIARGASRSA
jgi:hypothetical protein